MQHSLYFLIAHPFLLLSERTELFIMGFLNATVSLFASDYLCSFAQVKQLDIVHLYLTITGLPFQFVCSGIIW